METQIILDTPSPAPMLAASADFCTPTPRALSFASCTPEKVTDPRSTKKGDGLLAPETIKQNHEPSPLNAEAYPKPDPAPQALKASRSAEATADPAPTLEAPAEVTAEAAPIQEACAEVTAEAAPTQAPCVFDAACYEAGGAVCKSFTCVSLRHICDCRIGFGNMLI